MAERCGPETGYGRAGYSNELVTDLHGIVDMTSKGVRAHMCGLFHDVLVPLGMIQRSMPDVTEDRFVPGYGQAGLCAMRGDKLGCAHNGGEVSFGGNHRSVNGESRMRLQRAIVHLAADAPHLLSKDEAERLSRRVTELGTAIAQLDIAIGRRKIEDEETKKIRMQHDRCVEKLFDIAVLLEGKLQQALQEGRGYKPIPVRVPRAANERRFEDEDD